MRKIRNHIVVIFLAILFAQNVNAEEIRDFYSEPGLNPFKDPVGDLNESIIRIAEPGNWCGFPADGTVRQAAGKCVGDFKRLTAVLAVDVHHVTATAISDDLQWRPAGFPQRGSHPGVP